MLDLNKPVQTRNGQQARIICTDRQGGFPIVALVKDYMTGKEFPHTYQIDGDVGLDAPSDLDLVNVPERREAYLVITQTGKPIAVSATKLSPEIVTRCFGESAQFVRVEYEVPQ